MRGVFAILTFFLSPIILCAQADSDYDQKLNDLYEQSLKYCYTDQDSAYYYFEKMHDLTREQEDWQSGIWSLINWNRSAGNFYDLGQLDTNLKSLDVLFDAHKQEIDSSPLKLLFFNSLDYDKGIYYFEINDYGNSRRYFEDIINNTEGLRLSEVAPAQLDLLSAAYGFMAKMFANEAKYELAKTYYTKNIRLIKSKKPDEIKTLYRYYSLLAEVYAKEKKYEESNTYFIRSFKYGVKNDLDKKATITEADHIIENQLNLSRLDSAKYYLALLKELLPQHHTFAHKYHQARAKVLISENKPIEALAELKVALAAIAKKWNSKDHLEVAMAYMDIGNIQAEMGEFKNALSRYDQALQRLKSYNKTERLKLLTQKASVLNRLRPHSSNADALQAVDQGISVLDSLKPSFSSHQDKLVLIDDAFPLFESGLDATFTKFKKTQDREYLEKAFRYMEKSKSNLLLDALFNTKATQFAGIPQNLLEKEQQLKAEINKAEKMITLQDRDSPKLQEELFGLKKSHRELIHQFETDYPKYYDLRYNTDIASLVHVQNTLEKDQLMLSYFYGNKNIYALSVSRDAIRFEKIKQDDLLTLNIKEWVQLLADPKSDPHVLAKKGFFLYKKLIAPLLGENGLKKITIIPDGLLNYIPFGALNTDFQGLNYLLDKCTVSYTSSATLLDKLTGKSTAKNSVLAFAPGFDDPTTVAYREGGRLTPLPNAAREIKAIAAYFPEKGFTGSTATLSNFRSQASAYSMVHLATHALVDNEAPEYSLLAFSPQKEGDNLLYLSDLYNMHIPADLVTLSACETGIGALKRGEGMISLSRAFFYSGAKSLVNTLWNVNDNSSTELMAGFYKNLSQGLPKDEALRSAKLNFINKHREDRLSHPYYWSAFVVSGNTAPVKETYWFWWIFGCCFLLLTVAGFIFYRKRKKKWVPSK